MLLAMLLSSDTSTTGDPTIDLLLKAFGIPIVALFVLALIRGWLVTGTEYKRIVEERNREREERLKAQEALTERTLPVVLQAQEVLARATRVLDDFRTKGTL
jgi:hypothetical protein